MDMKKNQKIVAIIISLLLALSLIVFAYDKGSIDRSHSEGGYTSSFNETELGFINTSVDTLSLKRFKIVITNNTTNERYIYDLLLKEGEIEKYPIQMGYGDYSIAVYENIVGTRYSKKFSYSTKDVEVDNEFLSSTQIVKWSEEDEVIRLAEELETLENIYNYVVNNYKYDYEKIKTLDTTYIPNINETFISKSGICYDYAALFASMLRSQGIETKLVKGYKVNSTVYHAWNEVYYHEEWHVMDTTFDAYYTQAGIETTMFKSELDYLKIKEY